MLLSLSTFRGGVTKDPLGPRWECSDESNILNEAVEEKKNHISFLLHVPACLILSWVKDCHSSGTPGPVPRAGFLSFIVPSAPRSAISPGHYCWMVCRSPLAWNLPFFSFPVSEKASLPLSLPWKTLMCLSTCGALSIIPECLPAVSPFYPIQISEMKRHIYINTNNLVGYLKQKERSEHAQIKISIRRPPKKPDRLGLVCNLSSRDHSLVLGYVVGWCCSG